MFGIKQDPFVIEKEGLRLDSQKTALSTQSYADDSFYQQQREATSDLTKWQQDMSPALEELKHNLRSEYLDGTEWKALPGVKPLMNELGINKVNTFLKPLVSQNQMMTSYEQTWIYHSLKKNVLSFISILRYNSKYYGIEKGDLDLILNLVKGFIEPTHFRCLNNGERKFLTTINRRTEVFNNNQQEEKKKLFGVF